MSKWLFRLVLLVAIIIPHQVPSNTKVVIYWTEQNTVYMLQHVGGKNPDNAN